MENWSRCIWKGLCGKVPNTQYAWLIFISSIYTYICKIVWSTLLNNRNASTNLTAQFYMSSITMHSLDLACFNKFTRSIWRYRPPSTGKRQDCIQDFGLLGNSGACSHLDQTDLLQVRCIAEETDLFVIL